MRVRNPNFVSDVAAFAAANAATFSAWLAEPAQAAKALISFDEIRAGFPAAVDPLTGTAPLTDGTIAAVLAELGYEVLP